MKTTFRFIIAATAAISVFSSCQKELVNESANKTTDGVRTISVQFDNSTKASLSGFTPAFTNNDKIRVSNSTKSEECSVTVSGTTTTFTTTLSGALTAIYPEKAAVLASEASDAPIASSNNFKVSTSQTGELKDAIIAKATIAENGSVATFQGQTAVFRITPGAGNSTKYVEVITAGPEIANTATTEYTKKNKIHVETDDGGEVFVSVLVPDGGLKLRDLSFADGSKMKTVTDATKGATAINSNTIYTINSSGWDREYVEIGGLKWATMNVGATSATEAGKYFMWGETTGITPSGSSFSFPDSKYYSADNTSWDSTKGFAWENCPHTNGLYVSSGESKKLNVFTKYTTNSNYAYSGTADGLSILESADDAATANWGGSWRMPEQSEFNQLKDAVYWTWKANTGSYVFIPDATHAAGGKSDSIPEGWVESDALLFFPTAGSGRANFFDNPQKICYFWSSTASTSSDIKAKMLVISMTTGSFMVTTNETNKYSGISVRPVSD